MNELDLFVEWWERQEEYVVKMAKEKRGSPLFAPMEVVLDSYRRDRSDMVRSVVIERILISEDVENSEDIAKRVYDELMKLKEDAL